MPPAGHVQDRTTKNVSPSRLPSNEGLSAEATQRQKASALKLEANKLIKYFLASLTVPENDLWVNLSPYEKDRIVPESFGKTEMGRDLLAQDYMLKQITASLIYPEDETGKQFWQRVYAEAARKFGTTNIPVNTFNKVWIVPEKAVLYENAAAGTAYVGESRLKVMLEEDYLAATKNQRQPGDMFKTEQPRTCPPAGCQTTEALNVKATQGATGPRSENHLGTQIIRDVVLPQLTKEINTGKNFAQLRQVYSALILAAWYKKKIKESILAQAYAGKNKIKGVEYNKSVILSEAKDLLKNNQKQGRSIKDPSPAAQDDSMLIYQRYLEAFKKGAYNYIKEEQDPVTQQMVPRKYFSGGTDLAMTGNHEGAQALEIRDAARFAVPEGKPGSILITADLAMLGVDHLSAIKAKLESIAAEHPQWFNQEVYGGVSKLTVDRVAGKQLVMIEGGFFVGEDRKFTYTVALDRENDMTVMLGPVIEEVVQGYAFNSGRSMPLIALFLTWMHELDPSIARMRLNDRSEGSGEAQRLLQRIIERWGMPGSAGEVFQDSMSHYIDLTRINYDAVRQAAEGGDRSTTGKVKADAATSSNNRNPLKDEALIHEAVAVINAQATRANAAYDRRDGPFWIQQFIPRIYVDVEASKRTGEEVNRRADIHGGDALWEIIYDLFQSPVFAALFNFPHIPKDVAYKERLIDEFRTRGWITEVERVQLTDGQSVLIKLIEPYLNKIKTDRRGVMSISDADIRTLPGADADKFYSTYYEHTERAYGVLTRILRGAINSALPPEMTSVRDLPDGFVLKELKSGFYTDLHNMFHMKVKGAGDPVVIVDFKGNNVEEFFGRKPERLVSIFQWAAENNAILSDSLEAAVARISAQPGFVPTPAMYQAFFFELSKSPAKVSLFLVRMYALGILAKIFPELEEIRYHFEVPYHRYSVPIHQLRAIYALEYGPLDADTEAKYSYVASSDGGINVAMQRFVFLLHDLEKQKRQQVGEPHTIRGALHLTPLILERFPGISAEFRSRVQWLVWHHQEWTARLESRFIYSNLLELLDLGGSVLDEELLNIFYLHSYADANSVDPYKNTFDTTQQQTMLRMFHMLQDYFRHPERQQALRAEWQALAREEAEQTRAEVRRILLSSRPVQGDMQQLGLTREDIAPWVDEYVRIFSPAYYRTITNDSMAAQFRVFMQVKKEASLPELHAHASVSSMRTAAHGPMLEVLVGVNKDAKALLSKITAALAACGFDVLHAEIATTPEGEVFDRFQGSFLSQAPDDEYWQRFKQYADVSEGGVVRRDDVLAGVIKAVVEGRLTVDEVFDLNKAFVSSKRSTFLSSVARTQVVFEEEGEYTVLKLQTTAQLVLPYAVSRILAELGIELQSGPILIQHTGAQVTLKISVGRRGQNQGVLNRDQKNTVAAILESLLDREHITNADILAAVKLHRDRAMQGEVKNDDQNIVVHEVTNIADASRVLGSWYQVPRVFTRKALTSILQHEPDARLLYTGPPESPQGVLVAAPTKQGGPWKIHYVESNRKFSGQGRALVEDFIRRYGQSLIKLSFMYNGARGDAGAIEWAHSLRSLGFVPDVDSRISYTRLPGGTISRKQGGASARAAQPQLGDRASTSQAPGGIDLNPDKISLETKTDPGFPGNGGRIQFNIDPALLKQLQDAPGLTPVIIHMQPLTDMPLFLGLKQSNDPPLLAKT